MRKFKINIDGKAYEVEVEEITEGVKDIGTKVKTATSAKPLTGAPKGPAVQMPNKPVSVPDTEDTTDSSKGEEVNALDGEEVKAPVTGQVFKVETKVGETVSEGQVLLILEAMKMENEVQAPVSGLVSQVLVSPGQAVDSGDTLVVIETQ